MYLFHNSTRKKFKKYKQVCTYCIVIADINGNEGVNFTSKYDMWFTLYWMGMILTMTGIEFVNFEYWDGHRTNNLLHIHVVVMFALYTHNTFMNENRKPL